ncbi:M20 family metallopeptidase [Planctomycetota bacterium]
MKKLLQKLIQSDTTAEKGESAAAQIICDELRLSGIDCRIDRWEKNRANVTAQLKSGEQKGTILFACHLDVVPADESKWKYPPFSGQEKEGRIYGRGAADMKGGIAAAVTAIAEVVNSGAELNGDIILFCGAGEETDSCGAARFMKHHRYKLPNLKGVVIPEPTDFGVVTTHRGIFWLQITAYGKAAHSSQPQLGVNAIYSMQKVLAELEKYQIKVEPNELLGGCSMSVNTISGGKAMNIVPDKCDIQIDIRTLPGQDTGRIISDLKEIFAELKRENPDFEADVSIVREVGALQTDSNSCFVRDFCSIVGVRETKAVGFTTDGSHLAALGVPVVIFGPGKPELCHKPNEYIDIADLEKAVEYYKNIILKYLT